MKIVNFGVRPDEIPYFEQYSKELGLECVITANPPSLNNLDLLDDCVGITDIKARAYGAEFYQALQKRGIKSLSLRCAGFDGLDQEVGERYGIKFFRVPSYSPNAIAEYAVALGLMLIRNLHVGYARFRNQDYRIDNLIGREIRDFTVGVVGTGQIGTQAARIFQSFGGEVLAYDMAPSSDNKKWLTYVPLSELFQRANLISIMIPQTKENYHLINRKVIASMPQGTIIINTARGGLIDSEALYEGLVSGQIGGAALDVYEGEEAFYQRDMTDKLIPDPTFRKIECLPNTIITPHMAFNTYRAVENMVRGGLVNIKQFIETGDIDNQIVLQ